MNARTLALAAVGLVGFAAATASATTINSFLTVSSISGITVSNAGPVYTVTLPAGSTFTVGSNTYNITDIIGFYMIAPGYNDGSQGALATVGAFSDDSDHRAAGSIWGWKSNPNSGITPPNQLVFTYPSTPGVQYTQIGFHVRLDGLFPGTSGNTGNITGQLVPAPGAAALFGAGGLMAARRRRR